MPSGVLTGDKEGEGDDELVANKDEPDECSKDCDALAESVWMRVGDSGSQHKDDKKPNHQ
jgi:hypothetical protein